MELRMQYATATDGVRIAFGTAGSGPLLIRIPSLPFSHSQLDWERDDPFYNKLAANWTIVQIDPRGIGLSDRDVEDFSIDKRVLDIEAVMDKLGIESAPLHAIGWSAPPAVTMAVRTPERVSHLILDDAQVKIEEFMAIPQIRALDQLTGQWDTFLEYLAYMIYGYGREEAKPIVEFMKASVSADGAKRIFDETRGDDVTDLLPEITQPTLIIQHTGLNQEGVESVRRTAAMIPNARLVLLEGQAQDGTDKIIEAIADLLGTGKPVTAKAEPVSAAGASGVRTILFTDMVEHSEMMARLGDERGREVLRDHESVTRRLLSEHGGAEVKSLGDGFMASFGSVAKAVECAIALQRSFAERNEAGGEPLSIRVGLNVGEPIEEGGDLFGATVILASRIAAKAEAGEILVANAVRELSSGKGFLFADRGDFIAKGFEEPVRVFEVRWRE
jgi:class 3 adenylate cyclase